MTTMEIGRATSVAPERRSFGLLARVAGLFRRMAERHHQRGVLIELSRMDAYLLRDMGIERQDIYDALDGRNSSLLFDPVRRESADRS